MEDQTLRSRGGANSSSPGTPPDPAFGPGARSLEAGDRSFGGEPEARSIEGEAETRSFEARSFEARSFEAEPPPPPRPMEFAAKGAWLTSTGSGSRSLGLW